MESLQVENMIDKEKGDGFSNHFFELWQFGFTLSFLIKMFSDKKGRNYLSGSYIILSGILFKIFSPQRESLFLLKCLAVFAVDMGSLSGQGSLENMVEVSLVVSC